MTKAILLKCREGSQFRLGDNSKDNVSEIIHSDTLFSAIANIYELVFNGASEFINLVNSGKIIFSSAFPVLEHKEDKSKIYFFPKPVLFYNEESKETKNISFLSKGVLEDVIQNFNGNDMSCNINFSNYCLIGGKYCMTKDEMKINTSAEKFIREIVTPKTAVHKDENVMKDRFYHETNIQLNSIGHYNPHYFFLVNNELSKDELNDFLTCLKVLADTGIGGERSSGKGLFDDVEVLDEFKLPGLTKYFSILISLFNPKSNSEFQDLLYYDIVKRGGGSLGTEGDEKSHRKQLLMIKEGAVTRGKPEGRIVDVSPEENNLNHNLYRNGKAFLI